MVRSQISHDRQQLGTGMCYRATWQTTVLHGDALKDEHSLWHTQSIAQTLNQPFKSQENRHVPALPPHISDTTSTHPNAEEF